MSDDARCEYCGVSYADNDAPTVAAADRPESSTDAPDSRPDGDLDAQFTHCEFCGAEYPVPRGRSADDTT